MNTRYLTIESLFGYPYANSKNPAACLRLKGYWLIQWGFRPGDHVEVAPIHDGLTIRKVRLSTRSVASLRRAHRTAQFSSK
ncbi:MAG: SymE family type I addiction module toxin [Chthoniobacter sp.]|nr:SymE family type I addiction module toxin [Chthoniobacter sp.]